MVAVVESTSKGGTMYDRDGRATIHVLVRTAEDKEVFACGARLSRGGFRQRVSDETAVTCSRCAKRDK